MTLGEYRPGLVEVPEDGRYFMVKGRWVREGSTWWWVDFVLRALLWLMIGGWLSGI